MNITTERKTRCIHRIIHFKCVICVFIGTASSKSAAANNRFIFTFLYEREYPFYSSLKNSQIDIGDQFYIIDRLKRSLLS
ncbi:hypothetical protein EKN31_10185 [Enterobacter cloacae]|nr:hypothetical protein EKN55_09375 [Enterobacter cloacae]RUO05492.1 hypothetical protein EKN31_10185 [Enterobacter cloacae]